MARRSHVILFDLCSTRFGVVSKLLQNKLVAFARLKSAGTPLPLLARGVLIG